MSDGLFQSNLVENLAQPSINWNPHCNPPNKNTHTHTLCFDALESSTANMGPCQAGTATGTAFVGMVMGHCWRKRPSAYPGLKRAAAHRTPGTHYPV